MENAVQQQVLKLMNESGQMNKNLHAYKTLLSTTMASLQITDFIVEAADRYLVANAMMLNQSAAFDWHGY